MDVTSLTLTELKKALRSGGTTSVSVTEALLNRIAALDNDIKSYLTVNDEYALEESAAADKKLESGEPGSLLGIPIAVKDIISTNGIETTAGSKILDGFIPPL